MRRGARGNDGAARAAQGAPPPASSATATRCSSPSFTSTIMDECARPALRPALLVVQLPSYSEGYRHAVRCAEAVVGRGHASLLSISEDACCRGTWARVTITHSRNCALRCVRGKCAQQRRFSEWQLMRTLCRCRVCALTGHWLGTCAARVHTVAQHSLYTVQHNLYIAQRSLYTARRNLCTAQHNRCPTQMCAHCSPAQPVAAAEP